MRYVTIHPQSPCKISTDLNDPHPRVSRVPRGVPLSEYLSGGVQAGYSLKNDERSGPAGPIGCSLSEQVYCPIISTLQLSEGVLRGSLRIPTRNGPGVIPRSTEPPFAT